MKRKIVLSILLLFMSIGFIGVAALLMSGQGGGSQSKLVDEARIMEHIQYLASDDEFAALQYRVAGMEGEKKAAAYIQRAFEQNGLQVKQQFFEFFQVTREIAHEVRFTYGQGKTIAPTTVKTLANGNVNHTFRGRLLDLGKGSPQEFASHRDEINGAFLLLEVDATTSVDDFSALEFNRKVKGILAFQAGFTPPAEAVIAQKFIFASGRLYSEPVMTISTLNREDYQALREALRANPQLEISEELRYEVETEKRTSANLIASLPANLAQRSDVNWPVIVVGAHYDSVHAPGADDNAAGVAALIELGNLLKTKDLPAEIRLVAFGAEEVGLFGSHDYLSDLSPAERARHQLMVNLDGPGVGNILIIGQNTNEAENAVHTLACQIAEKKHIAYKKLAFPDSDQFYFARAGIPTLTFASLVDQNKVFWYSVDPAVHTFAELEKEDIRIPPANHTFNDTPDLILESNQKYANFQNLFSVLLGVLEIK